MAVATAPARPARRRPSAWGWLVAISAAVVVASGLAFAVWWLVTRERSVTTYSVKGALNGITLDLGSADAEIVGGGDRPAVDVRRTDRFSFGRQATSDRRAADGLLAIHSRCPKTILGGCSSAYRLTVPDNVPVTVRTTSGDVTFANYRGSAQVDTDSGSIAVADFCGFALRARSQTGEVSADATCAPERLELRSRSGDVRASVPPGRYQVDAETDSGSRVLRGLTPTDDAPFVIQALSSSGDVLVETSG